MVWGPCVSVETKIRKIQRLLRHDSDLAWQVFTETYDRMILAWLEQAGVQSADALDIRQEVLTTVHSEIETFVDSGDETCFPRWLRRVTANRMRRLWASRDRRHDCALVADLSSIADQLEDHRSELSSRWDRQYESELVQQCLDALGDRFSKRNLDAFRRVVLCEEPQALVAEDLGMSLGGLRVAQHRIMRALRRNADATHCAIG
ncbi:RNA polymerase sigma factor [Crateriforma conspicua]|uniref:RNA polymerase sigma factor n=1 Tax=Crateriforma conspicua TaxID=2527996 RepID=A0A5C5Y9S6_9PLAN|nr:RNA polymerase sigma factor [Crateriforma conspicua]TWT71668.1 RNA polymerase sigma factor [Crateriforma conspicua]